MSLQIWLTGNESIENLGIGSISGNLYSSPMYESGKMGKCLRTNFVRSSTLSCPELVGSKEFSIAFWFKMNTAEYTQWHDIITINLTTDGTNETTFRLETCNTTGTQINWFGSYFNSYGLNKYTVSNDIWYHQVIVVSESNIKFYINDILVTDYTIPSDYLGKYLTGDGIVLGDSGMDCSLNDLRIYDHCLSKKEIHEIYKSLILHYPLNNSVLDLTENLITNSWDMGTGWSIGNDWILSEDSDNGCTVAHFSRTGSTGNNWVRLIPPDKLNPDDFPNGIIVSFDFKCDDKSIIDSLTHGKIFCALQIYNSSGNRIGWYESKNNWGSYVTKTDNGSSDGNTCIKNGEWCRIATHFTQSNLKTVSTSGYTTDDVAYATISFQLVRDGSIYIRKIKVEAGSDATKYTPYTLNKNDELYTAIGLNTTTVTDCSGYGNDGIMSSLLNILNDSPRYATCTKFDTTEYIKCGSNAKVSDEITVTFWAFSNDWSTEDAHFASCTESGGWNFELASDGYYVCPIHCNDGYKNAKYTTSISNISSGWHMFTMTYDGYIGKVYLDGKLDGSVTASTNEKIPITYNINTPLFIHGESYTNATKPNTGYKSINMSDFRIYATALSESDIKELYDSPISLDKSGNLYSYEFIEE